MFDQSTSYTFSNATLKSNSAVSGGAIVMAGASGAFTLGHLELNLASESGTRNELA